MYIAEFTDLFLQPVPLSPLQACFFHKHWGVLGRLFPCREHSCHQTRNLCWYISRCHQPELENEEHMRTKSETGLKKKKTDHPLCLKALWFWLKPELENEEHMRTKSETGLKKRKKITFAALKPSDSLSTWLENEEYIRTKSETGVKKKEKKKRDHPWWPEVLWHKILIRFLTDSLQTWAGKWREHDNQIRNGSKNRLFLMPYSPLTQNSNQIFNWVIVAKSSECSKKP